MSIQNSVVRDEDVYPLGTVVQLKKTHEFAIIRDRAFLSPGQRNFLHYLGEIEGRKGLYCLMHQDIELECLPLDTTLSTDSQ